MFVRKYAPKPEDPVETKSAPKPAASTKPKKNKPMGKVEQEARIKELREKLAGGGVAGSAEDESPSGGRGMGAVESSGDDDDDDSEESEED
jgi:bromodomain-containing factor 1